MRQNKANVIASELPANSSLRDRVSTTDFLDCYSVSSNLSSRPAAEIITEFPGWARFLLQIRRVITTPFGLSNEGPNAADKIGPFPVEIETESELIAGFNDKHLDFRVSIFAQEGRVSLATWVHPHNIGGRIYLMTILPFHILIVRNALARVATAPSPAQQ
ncbi:DUF2867 domain-containing protein [Sneathiella marina]|uniref:DUF2867 domain-containing protein n=1 Tax=Sneathiella marina TaxID=2950108 RepID=A0ABY4W336_9PROT|nr:DUF2867 domain-containing protein [Sneathiella marina]USG61231.1 DUF2867 domain-containing protein [Sneathiella marina]